MIFISFLTLVFVFMAIYSVIFVRRGIIRNSLLLAYAAAIFVVWNPEVTIVIANFFGIGRGLDFVLVLFSVAIVNGIFFIVKHLSHQHRSITHLTRHIAIQEARLPKS